MIIGNWINKKDSNDSKYYSLSVHQSDEKKSEQDSIEIKQD